MTAGGRDLQNALFLPPCHIGRELADLALEPLERPAISATGIQNCQPRRYAGDLEVALVFADQANDGADNHRIADDVKLVGWPVVGGIVHRSDNRTAGGATP
jgi:hypothetical protein